ncbi:hypothetical protein [Streptomyces sp. NPDC058751]|uniref:hypothetical protein n=1 Tax=Streptomyces sp. NPDC058751 TaxID=3346623 RepID=UPI0036AE1F8B
MNAEEERQFREFVAARSRSLLHTAYLLTGDWEQGRDLLRSPLRPRPPWFLLVPCTGAMGLGFGTVVISDTDTDTDTETEAAAESTAAALRVPCCVMVTRARERGWSRVYRTAAAAPLGGLRG